MLKKCEGIMDKWIDILKDKFEKEKKGYILPKNFLS
jgi:hypothetical protein